MDSVPDSLEDLQSQMSDLSLGLNSSDEAHLVTMAEEKKSSEELGGSPSFTERDVDKTSSDIHDAMQLSSTPDKASVSPDISSYVKVDDVNSNVSGSFDSSINITSNAVEVEGDTRVVQLRDDTQAQPSSATHEIRIEAEDDVTAADVFCSAYTDFTCGLCKLPLQDPRMLVCLHAFCYQCLDTKFNMFKPADDSDQVQDDETKVKERRIKCPSCKQKTKLTGQDIKGLPPISFLQHMADVSKLVSGNLCGVCKLQDLDTPAVSICEDCNDLLCQDCADKHTFTKFTLSHKVKPLDRGDMGEQSKHLRQEQERRCEEHENEMLKFYCKSCDCRACRDCILLEHPHHVCVPMSNLTAGLRKHFVTLIMGLADKLGKMNNEDEQVLQDLNLAEQNEIELVNNITTCIIEHIKMQRMEAVDQLQAKFEEMRRRYVLRKSVTDKVTKEIKDTLNMSKQLADNSLDEEFIEVEKEFRKRMVYVLNRDIHPDPVSWFTTPAAVVNKALVDSQYQLKNRILSVTNAAMEKHPLWEELGSKPSLADILHNPEQWKEIVSFCNDLPVLSGRDNSAVAQASENSAVKKPVPELVTVDSQASDSENSSIDKTKGAIPKKKRSRNRRFKRNKDAATDVMKSMVAAPQHSKYSDLLGNAQMQNGMSEFMQRPFGNTTGPAFFGGESMQAFSSSPYNVGAPGAYAGGSTVPVYNSVPVVLKQQQQKTTGQPKQKKSSATKNVVPQNTMPSPKMVQVSISPKWRLDTRLEGDLRQPFLTCVHPILPNKLIVSDSNNNKVKIFDVEGHPLEHFDAINPTSVAYVSGAVVWCSGNNVEVLAKDKSKTFKRTLNFQKHDVPHPVAWFPKKHCIIGNGDHIRFYQVSLRIL